MRGQLRIFPFDNELRISRFDNMVLYQRMKTVWEERKKKPTGKATGWLL